MNSLPGDLVPLFGVPCCGGRTKRTGAKGWGRDSWQCLGNKRFILISAQMAMLFQSLIPANYVFYFDSHPWSRECIFFSTFTHTPPICLMSMPKKLIWDPTSKNLKTYFKSMKAESESLLILVHNLKTVDITLISLYPNIAKGSV